MPRILVADDNTNIQKMVSLAFQERGIEVTSVGNGEAAVRRLPGLNPDLILADIFMPVRNGYELCEWVKKDPKFSHIPVILLVGAFDPLDEKEARRVGADGVLKKPFIPPDPLIAMVTSALEKSLKHAAESASPKETLAAAPIPMQVPVSPPAHAAAVDTSLKIEPKRLPEFPEPSPEEASVVYGFGTGRRALDEIDVDEPAAARAPISEADKEAEEEFSGVSTTNDWRRSAMKFEVPEEAARRPAFSSDQDIESAFPSERAVPPKHIQRSADSIEEIERLAQQLPAKETPAHPPLGAEEQGVEEQTQVAAVASASEQSEPKVASPEPVATEGPTQASATEADVASAKNTDVDVQEAPAIQAEASPEPSFSSRASHWMDLMAPPLEPQPTDWFASTFTPREQAEAPRVSVLPDTAASPSIEELPAAEPETSAQTSDLRDHAEAESAISEPEPFFTDDPETSEPELWLASTVTEPEVASEPVSKASAEPPGEIEEQPLLARESPDSSDATAEFVTELSDERDSQLIEPPAVHETTEHLLADESPRDERARGGREQEMPPGYLFLSRLPQFPALKDPFAEENVAEQAHGGMFAAPDDSRGSPLEFSSSEFDERIPTGPLPSCEALADIPFLNLPPAFRESVRRYDSADDAMLDSPTVDSIVQKVLDKIEPQLRELLSRNVLKPLVEGLLQSELEKKDR